MGGSVLPARYRQSDLLRQYARAFNTVELDTTFHAIPRRDIVASWRAAVSDDFLFSAKLPRVITHMKRLRGIESDLESFLYAMEPLGDRLGVLLVQLPPDFHSDERSTLEAFLLQLSNRYRWAIEVRHRSWIHPEVFDLLSQHSVAWTIVDMIGMPTVPEVTTDFAYVRWLGDRNLNPLSDIAEVDRAENVDRWSATIRDLSFRADRVYGYVSDTWAVHAPASVRALGERLGLAMPGAIPGGAFATASLSGHAVVAEQLGIADVGRSMTPLQKRPWATLIVLTVIGTLARVASFRFNIWPHGDVVFDAAIAESLAWTGRMLVPIVDVRYYPTSQFGFGYPPDQHPPLWPLMEQALPDCG